MAETPQGQGQETLSNLLQESRSFPPPADLAADANVQADAYDAASADRLRFWEEQARRLQWEQPWSNVLEWNPPFAKWFTGGKLNAAVNCVDRHVDAGRGDRVAFYWEGEPGDTRAITYADLKDMVCQAANALTELGVNKGDRVAVYMPMIPETVVAMLACARIGAVHMVVFGGFSVDALGTRLDDSEAKLVITADGGYRRGKPSSLKPAVDDAVRDRPAVENVLVVRRTGQEVEWNEGRDVWWHDIVDRQPTEHDAEAHDAEHPLYIMYTSGTTAKPKGILHTTGGYLTQVAYTHWAVFDLKPESDVFWTAADIGWVTGHSYIVYGPLANGATSVMYEGTPDTPHKARFWEIVQKYGVTLAYMAPTAIRTFMKWGEEYPAQYDLSSLRVLGSVGEPINPEAYMWYRTHIGGNRTPIVDTWWQTETGAIMVTPMPGITHGKPGAAMHPIPGVVVDVVDESGESVPNGHGGLIVVREPWPAMLRGIWGDPERYKKTYWSRFEGLYFPGDGAKRDEDGDLWLLGRVDDVMLVSGHNISTTEVESALVAHNKVAEAAVTGASDPVTGQAIVAFVILRSEAGDGGADMIKELRDHVGAHLGPIAKPRQILVVPELPKTRSGKIMRRLLKDVAENRELGDVSTLTDAQSIETLKEAFQESGKSDE
ncbi:acetate--CoA ligase [Streptomonospora litoralis]|uniref:Acetyl-coenzyme A synthetase n=1 Tax=Streptomonospora litoralis TaxID=2498135 RepID=A0A4P6PV05_9ACTN|nr:acetate--CoA ligase [Streptomonospora litoralis]QBI51988.1 Acetyl-coenzyme A synthetase [Streptomonospora litoralis]